MKSLSKLTVGEYQQLYSIHKSDDDEVDKSIQSVSILTGLTRWEVEDMDLSEFRAMAREISILFGGHVIESRPKTTLKINGKWYYVCLNVRHLTAGQYIDLQHFLKGNMIDNLHKLMACLLVPVKKYWFYKAKGKYDGENHEKISEGIQDLNFIDVHATCVFFLALWNNSIKAIQGYLTNQLKKTGKNLPEMDLEKIMGGYIMPSK